jgi:hypothetical protein
VKVRLTATVDSTVSADVVRRALLDFSDERPDLWPQLDPKTYKVHWVAETTAELTEGTAFPKVWSREHYDWSHPTRITWTAVESNFCVPGSHVSMDIQPGPDGGSRLTVVWDRTAANLRGRINLFFIGMGGNRLLRWATRKSLDDVAKAYGDA